MCTTMSLFYYQHNVFICLMLIIVLLDNHHNHVLAFITQNGCKNYSSKVLKQQQRSIFLFSSSSDNNEPIIRFMGKGSNAIIRPGVTLIAPSHEYNHFLMKSAVFIYAVGLNDYDEMVARGT